MRLKALVIALLGIWGGLTIGLSLLLISHTTILRNNSRILLDTSQSVATSLLLTEALLSHAKQSDRWNTSGLLMHRDNRENSRMTFLSLLDQSRLYVSSEEEDKLVKMVDNLAAAYFNEQNKFASPQPQTGRGATDASDTFRKLSDAIQKLVLVNMQQAEDVYVRSAKFDEESNQVGILATVLALALALIILVFFYRYILHPLDRLAQSLQSFRSDEVLVFPKQGIHEINRIAEAFNEAKRELGIQKQMRVRYMASVAHDLRNPIHAIGLSANIGLLRYREKMPSEVIRLLEIIQGQANNMNRMIGDLIDTVRSENDDLEIHKTDQDLRTVVHESCKLFENFSQKHAVVAEIDKNPVPVSVDAGRMAQVFNNLICNAIKYSPQGGTVHVTLSKDEKNAIVAVKDEGIGIDETDKQAIFEAFKRTHKTEASIPGVGLGLYTSKKIVKAHGGYIDLKSREGEGSEFYVYLPLLVA